MKKMMLIFSLGSVVVFSGCSALVPKPTLSLQGVKFGKVDLTAATLLFDVEVENPYSVELPLLDMDYSLTTQKNPLFKGQADIATTIPAKEKKTVSLPVSLRYVEVIDALETVKGIRPGSIIPYDAALSISTKAPIVGKIKIPVQTSGNLQIPTLQDVSSWKSIFEVLEKIKPAQ